MCWFVFINKCGIIKNSKACVKLEGNMPFLKQFLRADGGATALEYAMIAALISAVIVVSVETLGIKIGAAFQYVVSMLYSLFF